VCNGVRQGGILSPAFFNLYVDELSTMLLNMKTGCNINNVFINHLMYADDTVLLAPSPAALQKLIDCCLIFAKSNDMIFNSKKTVCMYIKSKKLKDLNIPQFYLDGKLLSYNEHQKYLGVFISDNCKNDKDMNRQMRSLYGRGNVIIRNFKHCTEQVKIQLFMSFCSNIYCGHLWSSSNVSSFSKVRIAFKQIYRSLMKMDRTESISYSMLTNNVDNFDILIRKSVYNFRNRLMESNNVLICVIIHSMCFLDSHLYKRWHRVLF